MVTIKELVAVVLKVYLLNLKIMKKSQAYLFFL